MRAKSSKQRCSALCISETIQAVRGLKFIVIDRDANDLKQIFHKKQKF